MTITNRSGIYTLQIPPVIRECSHLRQVMKQNLNSVWKRQYSTRMVHGSMVNLTNEENGYLVTADDMSMMPIYIGVEGEENQGLCTGSENYWCVNSKASAEDQQATLDFLNWVITSDAGRESIAHEMGFTTPFDTFHRRI